jgi:ATP-dependent Clp protease ATP-binding subunit ClpB
MPYNFSNRTRVILQDARGEALALGHDSVECLHILLAILHDPSPSIERALADLGRTPAGLLDRLEARIVAAGPALPPGDLPYEAEAKTALVKAMEASRALGDDSTSPDHLLVGLAAVAPSRASRFLHEEGLSADLLQSALTSPRHDSE